MPEINRIVPACALISGFLFLATAYAESFGSMTRIQTADQSVVVTLHPQPSLALDQPAWVSFGIPFADGVLENAQQVRVFDDTGAELPASIRPILKWRNLREGRDGKYLRAAIVQAQMSFRHRSAQKLTVKWGQEPRKSGGLAQPVRKNWVVVNDAEYPERAAVHEPTVYATLPAEYLSRAGVYPRTSPFSSVSRNKDMAFINSVHMEFFKTAINRFEKGVKDSEKIPYLTDAEPWLYDRASTFYRTYVRSGSVDHLKAAHRAAEFYRNNLGPAGYFLLKKEGPDLKYSYGESLLAELILFGDETVLPVFERLINASNDFNTEYHSPTQFWTERGAAYRLLISITAYEATGKSVYARRAMTDLDHILAVQNNPPGFIIDKVRNDGCFIHTAYSAGEGDENQFYCSPWMTTLLLYAMQRYDMISPDERIAQSAVRMADFTLRLGSRIDDEWLHGENLPYRNMRIPYYLVSSFGVNENDPWTDKEHAIDAAKIMALGAYYARQLKDARAEEFQRIAYDFVKSARANFETWIRPNGLKEGKPVYRLSPARKFNWWFNASYDVDFLLSGNPAREH